MISPKQYNDANSKITATAHDLAVQHREEGRFLFSDLNGDTATWSANLFVDPARLFDEAHENTEESIAGATGLFVDEAQPEVLCLMAIDSDNRSAFDYVRSDTIAKMMGEDPVPLIRLVDGTQSLALYLADMIRIGNIKGDILVEDGNSPDLSRPFEFVATIQDGGDGKVAIVVMQDIALAVVGVDDAIWKDYK